MPEIQESTVPEYAVAKGADIRRLLEITPEKKQTIEQEQDELLKIYRSRARLSPVQRRIARGIELERHHRQTKKKDSLAEALAMQGRFAEAAKIANSKEMRKVFRERAKAVTCDDADCKCDSYRIENGLLIPNQFVESYAFSQKHDAEMPFIRCLVCGKLNARPMLAHLAEQQQARRESEQGNEVKATEFFQKI